jgi:Tfp pilus assembly protein PilF
MPRARAAARRALEIDEAVPKAHTALGFIAENYDWDWPTAEREYRRAIQLNPNDATAHHWYAECLALQGRFDEAFPEMERARQLDPLSLIIAADNGAILLFSRQYDRAIDQFRALREMEPNFPAAAS